MAHDSISSPVGRRPHWTESYAAGLATIAETLGSGKHLTDHEREEMLNTLASSREVFEALDHIVALWAAGNEISNESGDRQKNLRRAAVVAGWTAPSQPKGGRKAGSGVDYQALAFRFSQRTSNYTQRTPLRHWRTVIDKIAAEAMISPNTLIGGLEAYRASVARELANHTLDEIAQGTAKLEILRALRHLPSR